MLAIALVGILIMFVLIFLRIPVAFALAISGIVGYAFIDNQGFAFADWDWIPALGLLSGEFMNKISSPDMAIVPMFVLMGNLATVAGLSSDIYRFANAVIGHVKGGLAMATIMGCGIFGAICGSVTATAATFIRVAEPQMLSRGYGKGLTWGTIAAGGGLGMLVPPSINLVIYAVMTEQFIVELFMAAFIPAFICIVLFCLAVAWTVWRHPEEGPAGRRQSARAMVKAAGQSWVVLLLMVVVLGGIYGGIFTVNEAAAVGCLFTMVVAIVRKAIDRKTLISLVKDTINSSCMVYMLLIGASVFGYFITMTQMPQMLVAGIADMEIPPWLFFLILTVVYIILGAIFDCMATMLITLPLLIPVLNDMGFSLVWWGIVNMAVFNVGGISPPIGLNIFVVQGMTNAPLPVLYKGIVPFVAAAVIFIFIVVYFPGLSLWLPNLLMH